MRKGMRVEGKGRVLISPFAICCLSPQLPYGQVPCIFPCLSFTNTPDPYTGYSVPWLLAILPQCLHCLPNCSTSALTTPLLLGSPAPIPDDQDFDVLCFMLQFSSHCMEGSNSKQHRLCFVFYVFSQESKLFGIQRSRWMWKEGGCVSSSQSLILTAEAKDGYIYADQNRFFKHLPAVFEQSAHNCSCYTGGSTSKSWIEFEVWFILVVGQLPVFPLGWSCVNPALIFSEKSSAHIYIL